MQLTGAIQTIISAQPQAQSTRPYSEYGDEYYSQEMAASAEQETENTLDIQKNVQSDEQVDAKQCEDNDTLTDKDLTPTRESTQAQVSHQGANNDSKPLQWVDIEGKPINTPNTHEAVYRPIPKTKVVHYFFFFFLSEAFWQKVLMCTITTEETRH